MPGRKCADSKGHDLPPEAWAAFERFIVGAGDTLRAAVFPRDERSVTALLLVGSIVDGLPALVATLRSAGATYMPVIARTMVEALVDLRLLLASDAYLEQMRLRTIEGEVRRARGLVRAYKSLGGNAEKIAGNELREQQALEKLAALKAAGVKPVGKMEQRLRRAEIEATLATSFYWLTPATHNDLSVLKERHMRSGRPMFWEGLPDEKKAMVLHAGGLVAVIALAEIGRHVVPKTGREYMAQLEQTGKLFEAFTAFVGSN